LLTGIACEAEATRRASRAQGKHALWLRRRKQEAVARIKSLA
jgi:hypothetical protein